MGNRIHKSAEGLQSIKIDVFDMVRANEKPLCRDYNVYDVMGDTKL